MPHYTSENTAHIGTIVFLDGEEIRDAVECHTDEGWVKWFARNESGHFYADEDGNATTKCEYGVVTAYPAITRLSPDGKRNICDQCGREWRLGQGPDCKPCRDAWARIDAQD